MVNKVILVGNVGRDPEMRTLEGGSSVCTLPLATNETYTKDGEKVSNTEWHNIVLWRKLAEITEKYVKKGDLICVEGKIRTRSYDDKEGNKKYSTEIVADGMKMMGKRESADAPQSQPTTPSSQPTAVEPQLTTTEQVSDDLPF